MASTRNTRTGRFNPMTIEDHLNDNVFPEPNTGCWLWSGSLSPDGYGVMSIKGKTVRAHREVYKYFKNSAITPDVFICHSCDTPSCVNPDHLFEGTPAENSQDMVNKDRQARGEKNGRAKLTESDVKEIRRIRAENPKLRQVDIAQMFGVSQVMISYVLISKNWNHAP